MLRLGDFRFQVEMLTRGQQEIELEVAVTVVSFPVKNVGSHLGWLGFNITTN